MRRVIKECRKLSIPYGIKTRFKRLSKDLGGYSDFEKRLIVINSLYKSRAWILSTFFHELVHFYCYDNNIYYLYHHSEFLEDKLRFGLKVERYVDTVAAKWLSEYDSKITYEGAYAYENQKSVRGFFVQFYT